MKKSANQTINGKAFEYALLKSFDESLKTITSVSILENNIYIVQHCNVFRVYRRKNR